MDNKDIVRQKLAPQEAVVEAKKLMEMGHKRVLLVAGEDTRECNLDYIKEIIDKIYEEKVFNGEIRRLNLNIAPLSTEEYKRLSGFGIGTIQIFQETYHPEVYKKMHPSGPKANYSWRLECMDRALEGGLHDIGMGALFGLCDFRFEVLALLAHSEHLLNKYGVGPHTLSIPRIEPADGSDLSTAPPHAITDEQFKKIVSVLRLSVPYTGMILTTRESAKMRAQVLDLGISQMSAGSKTNPGGYSKSCSTSQFTMADERSLNEVVKYLCEHDFMPSFCTSCYRVGRVGKDFMHSARNGEIHKFCTPNAISTFNEFLADYAEDDVKKEGYALIEREMAKMDDSPLKQGLEKMLTRAQSGERDIYI
ncbi:Fe-hydrogenase maturase HydG [Candidatus Gastranaerophilus sp. (ex Termes propinquus)]|nr:Fe-hydrogenase maturase HydG [Candidatus Gastranaerophilus sp. (ex Termes propinquus)]